MKKLVLILFTVLGNSSITAQDINVADSVIYFNNKPVAYYVKTLNETDLHYNVYIISLDMKLLLTAQVAKFEAPVQELKPFYYYYLIVENEKDTSAIYYKGQAFDIELATLLKTYNLLNGNKINTTAWLKFKTTSKEHYDFINKITEYQVYLNETRNYSAQVKRDRTKPVTIVNERTIMQDGVKIGILFPQPFQVYILNVITPVNLSQFFGDEENFPKTNVNKLGEALFNKSLSSNPYGVYYMLEKICYLISIYAL
jgi:hypothetical protein